MLNTCDVTVLSKCKLHLNVYGDIWVNNILEFVALYIELNETVNSHLASCSWAVRPL